MEIYEKNIITTAPLSSLKPIKSSDLELFHTHVGYYLKLKVSFSYKMAAIHIECQDEKGRQMFASVYNFPLNGKPSANYFYPGRVFYIKEPFFKISQDGRENIRIDDPSDIEFQKKENQATEDYKKNGRQLVSKSNFVGAYCLYEQALNNSQQPADQIIFLLNKAIVCSKLNLKQEYGESIRKVLLLSPNNEKANFHLIKYETTSMKQKSDPNKFQILLERVRQSKVMGEGVKKELQSFIRLHETFQTNKNINWAQAIQTGNLGEYFNPKVKVGTSPFGRGLFATQDIVPGQMLLIQSPLFSFPRELLQQEKKGSDYYITNFKQKTVIRDKILSLFKISKQFQVKLRSLSTGSKQKKMGQQLDMSEIEIILQINRYGDSQIRRIFKNNEKIQSNSYDLLYENICLLNHRCESNCDVFNIGTSGVAYATTQIKKGEEIFISYIPLESYEERTHILQWRWGIECNCIMCKEQQAAGLNIKIEKAQSKNFEIYRLLASKDPLHTIMKHSLEYYLKERRSLYFIERLYQLQMMNPLADQLFLNLFAMTQQELKALKKLAV